MNKRFMKSVIDRELSLIDVLEKLGVVTPGSLVVNHTCYCPFHNNTDTKAAKIYDDERGVTLFCFSEQKSFRSSDAFSSFSDFSLEVVFNSIWSKLSEDQKSYYLNNYNADSDVIDEKFKSMLSELDGFKKRNISYSDVLDIILKYGG